VKDVLRAAASAAFVVGLLLMMLNPPSLSGAEELVSLLAGAVALMVLTAAVTVWLTERDSMSEPEFERLVEHSERLASQPPQQALAESQFELLVAEAIDELPEEFREALEQVPVVVSRLGAEHRAYGHYYGDTIARDNYEERIVIYQDTLERDFGHDPDLLRAQVVRTLRHEVAHHLGWGEKGVQELGL
jgi:predicted Zn-dependent protease with MMP-like domain